MEYFIALVPGGILVLRGKNKVGQYYWYVCETGTRCLLHDPLSPTGHASLSFIVKLVTSCLKWRRRT